MPRPIIIAYSRCAAHTLPFLIGRDGRANLMVHDDRVSGRHCRILEKDGKFLIEDMGSKNGTYLNGRPVEGQCDLGNSAVLRI